MISSVKCASAVILAAGAALLAAPAQAGSASAVASRPAAAGGDWRVFSTVAQRGMSAELESIDAVGPADAWAGGLIGGPAEQHQRALLVHWNGRAWRRVALAGRAASVLGGSVGFVYVAAKSDRDAWVFSQTGRYLRLRNGRWIPGRVPLRRVKNVLLDQAVVFGPSDVWVFGLRFVGPLSRLDLRPNRGQVRRPWLGHGPGSG